MPSCGVRLSVTFVYCVDTSKDTSICYGMRIEKRIMLSTGTIFNDLELSLTQSSKSRQYTCMSVTVQDAHVLGIISNDNDLERP